jgi:hypothetical protein
MTKASIGNYLLTLAVGLLFGILLTGKSCKEEATISETKIETIHKRDTIYIPKVDTFLVISAPKTPYRSIPSRINNSVNASVNIAKDKKNFYRDTINSKTQGVKLFYDIAVEGLLVDSVKLGFIDSRPQRIIVDSIKTTNTILLNDKGLYLGATIGNKASVDVGAQYHLKRNIFGGSINVISRDPNESKYKVSYYRKVF